MPNETPGNDVKSKDAKLDIRLRQLSPKQRELLEKRRKGNTTAIEAKQAPLTPAADAPGEVPLTPVQQAYWIGRSTEFSMGSVAAFGYAEFDVEDLEMDQVEAAWNRLIERHPALRTVITAEGRQKFLYPAPNYAIKVHDASRDSAEDRDRYLDKTRQSMSHQVMDCTQWPLFDVRATRLSDSRHRLHVGFDTIIVDARSFDILSNELDQLLEDPVSELAPLGITFGDYVNRSAQDLKAMKARARSYWDSRLDTLPPAPPLAQQHGAEGDSRRFARLLLDVPRCHWDRFCGIAGERQLTPSSVLLTAFAEVISHWSGADDFTLNLTRFNRRPVHPDVENIVGCFTDLSLLEVNRRDAHTFEERAKALQARLWEDIDHTEFGATEIMRELSKREGAMRLMPVVFTSALGGVREAGRGRLGKPVYAISQTPQVTIDCQVTESSAGVEIFWDYAKNAFPDGYVEAMFSQFRSIMERTLANDSAWDEYELAKTPPEHLSQRADLETVGVFPGPALLHALIDFSKSDATAVAGLDHALSYRALDTRANAIAAELQRAGVQYQDLVGVSMARGPDQIAAVLGVLRAGAAFVPLSPDLPPARLETLVRKAGIKVLVTGAACVAAKAPDWVATVRVDGALAESEPVTASCSPNDLAYVIFTSGTTGSPKGVMISHQSAVNTVCDMIGRFGLDRHDVLLGISDLAFDLSIFDIFGALAVGGTLVTTASDVRKKDPAHFHDLIDRRQVTVWNSVPAIMGVYCDYLGAHGHKAPSLRTVFMSGDWIPTDLPERIFKLAPNANVYSGGGATEASIWSVIHPITSVDPAWTSIPYGSPLTNQTARVANCIGQEAPDWVVGELHIGGAGVAMGYLGDPALTADRFVPDPKGGGARLYRTGDYALHRDDGGLTLLGRTDSQVKINGFRVDLSEIEARLLDSPDVNRACVLSESSDGRQIRLRAFVVCDDHNAGDRISEGLQSSLPEYMIPARIEIIDAMPLTRNGKIDRPQLLATTQADAAPSSPTLTDSTCAPRPVADALARIVVAKLDLDAEPGLAMDLPALGADSLAILRILNEVRLTLGVELGLRQVMTDPVLANIVVQIETRLIEIAQRASANPGSAADAASEALFETGEI